MEQSPDQTVATGLSFPEPSQPTPPEAEAAPANEPINVSIPDDVTVPVAEVNQPLVVATQAPPAQDFAKDVQEQAENDNLKRDFVQGVMARRQEAPPAYQPPPVPERIAEQTRLEIEAGKANILRHEAMQANRPRPQHDLREGTTKSVLRPEDFIPKFHQGHVPTNSYRPM